MFDKVLENSQLNFVTPLFKLISDIGNYRDCRLSLYLTKKESFFFSTDRKLLQYVSNISNSKVQSAGEQKKNM